MSPKQRPRSRSREARSPPKNRERRTLAGWRANALDLELCVEDLELLDRVLTVVPLLRIVARIGQEARRRGLSYPIENQRALVRRMGSDRLELAGHRIDAESIVGAIAPEWFPMVHEGEFLSRVHLALLRCQVEADQARARPSIGGQSSKREANPWP